MRQIKFKVEEVRGDLEGHLNRLLSDGLQIHTVYEQMDGKTTIIAFRGEDPVTISVGDISVTGSPPDLERIGLEIASGMQTQKG